LFVCLFLFRSCFRLFFFSWVLVFSFCCFQVPKMEQKLKKIEQKLVELETTSAQTVNAFLWFSTSYERNYVVKTLTGTSHGVGTCRHV